MKTESGEFICKAWGILLEGMTLAYNLVNDEPDWIPIEGCMGDLLQAEATSTKELSELVPQPWEWKACRALHVERGQEEGTESSPPTDDNKTDDGPFDCESPTDSGGSRATCSVSTSKEEWGTDSGHVADQELVSESSHEEKETTKEPIDEETPSDTESEGSAMTDNTLGSIAPSSQEVMLLESPLDLGHSAGVMAEQNRLLQGVEDPILQWWVGTPPTQCIRSKGKTKSQNPYPSTILHKQSQMGHESMGEAHGQNEPSRAI